ncbi:hypothetical protein ABZ766_15745 [Streptomyces sp. NPDC006670]|uniref:hypothetical protein n=1 Tax=Streptomyces sp. NPDC006670 TaxID=3154476 RepID=UPI0033F4A52F
MAAFVKFQGQSDRPPGWFRGFRRPYGAGMDLSGIASICALAGIPAALLAAHWQTKSTLAQAEATRRATLEQGVIAARRTAYAKLISEATQLRRLAWHEEYAAVPERAMSTFEAAALARLEAPEGILPLVGEVYERATHLNRILSGQPDREAVVAACRGLRDAVEAFTGAARGDLAGA